MFINNIKQRSRNGQSPVVLFKPCKKSPQQYIKLYNKVHNKRGSWYRKKKIIQKHFWDHATTYFLNRYMVISRFYANDLRKVYDIRLDSYGNLHTHISSWGLNYKKKIFNLFTKPKYFYFQFALYGQQLWFNSPFFSKVFHHFHLDASKIYATSPGTFVRVWSLKRSGLLTLILPSKQRLECYQYISFIVGRNEGVKWQNVYLAKAGSQFKTRSLCKVRGIAKNPIDHPNGGNSNTKGSLRTPWGRFAKSSK